MDEFLYKYAKDAPFHSGSKGGRPKRTRVLTDESEGSVPEREKEPSVTYVRKRIPKVTQRASCAQMPTVPSLSKK